MYRSRLSRLEEKRNLRSAVLLMLGTVGLIGLLIILGVPILVRLAVFVGDLKSANRPVDKNDLIPPGPPQIAFSYDATNSATMTLAGAAEPGSTVYLTQNGKSTVSVVTREDGGWQVSSIKLEEGQNKFVGVAVDGEGNKSLSSREYSVWYSTKTPVLNLDSPTDQQQISGGIAKVDLRGTTGSDVRLYVNDRIIIVNSEGKFNTTFNLNPGDNKLVFLAVDRAGNQTRREIIVKYSP